MGFFPEPQGTYVLLVDNTVAGQTYDFQISMLAAKPVPQINPIEVPEDNTADWRLTYTFNVPKQVISGKVSWDDIDVVGSPAYFYKDVNQTGTVNLLMTDSDNYMFYTVAHMADAFNLLADVQSGEIVFDIPALYDWYAFMDAVSYLANAQLISGTLRYEHYVVGNDDNVSALNQTELYPASPNPFNPSTRIRYSLNKNTDVSVAIYNLKGQKVISLHSGISKAGMNTLNWDGTDQRGKLVGSGVYYIKMTDDKHVYSRKVLLLK